MDHPALVIRLDKHDHVRESFDELTTHDTAFNRGDRCGRERLFVRDAHQHPIDLGYER